MKKWKQILALTLAVVVTLSVVPVGDARAAVEEPTEYAIVGEIVNADGAEITVREVSKDGTPFLSQPYPRPAYQRGRQIDGDARQHTDSESDRLQANSRTFTRRQELESCCRVGSCRPFFLEHGSQSPFRLHRRK